MFTEKITQRKCETCFPCCCWQIKTICGSLSRLTHFKNT